MSQELCAVEAIIIANRAKEPKGASGKTNSLLVPCQFPGHFKFACIDADSTIENFFWGIIPLLISLSREFSAATSLTKPVPAG